MTQVPDNDAWLFVRRDQAIHITKLPMGMALIVRGPGLAEHSHHFDTEESLDEFWRWYKRHLLGDEWVLTPDRRSTQDRAAGPERRRPGNQAPRAVPATAAVGR